ncbi:MAG: phosphoribosylformylglycinamidine synthase subunit PurQ [Bacteroidia bacterium]|nr:phosphoribosylformylglycinamidine synthase subunit PurQ [Bacteroidia bacterium]MCX7763283.1 phosphoribosylformylglycinamidine synthase subunit PurQ [Bacteroidia bacterium]MDW8058169.1 phosphoribosylformylglycinamidine synthase subunit PurQ [Bacteroidia bacterium]
MRLRAGIVVFPGSNCDRDLYYALERAGFTPFYLWHGDHRLPPLEAVFFPGGFSYGDYLRAGAIARFAQIMPAVENFWRKGGFVMGICNGFQIILEAGWLPGALRKNSNGRFISQVVSVSLYGSGPLSDYLGGRSYRLPIAHAEGRYVPGTEIPSWSLRYEPAPAPNGSYASIAGFGNEEGTVFGLMPHPERACDPYQGQSDGLDFLRAIARYLQNR